MLPKTAWGHNRTFGDVGSMSGLPPKADIKGDGCHVRLVPEAAVSSRSKVAPYSITSSARASKVGGTSRPSALAVLRLMTRSNFVGC
jgi:hypothetical protein